MSSDTAKSRPSRRRLFVIMDNLSSHKIAGVQEAIEATGASRRFLPAYNPNLEPIEQLFTQKRVAQNGAPNCRRPLGRDRDRPATL